MKFILCALMLLAPAVFAQGLQQQQASSRAWDDIARLETAHLKEMMILLEKKNEQLRLSDINANEQRFKAQEQAVAFALASAEKATLKADVSNEKRFDGVNEFRSQLKDQAGTFLTRNELWGWLVALIMMAFAAYNAFVKRKAVVNPEEK
jgi:hypothetical protein